MKSANVAKTCKQKSKYWYFIVSFARKLHFDAYPWIDPEKYDIYHINFKIDNYAQYS